MNNSKKLLGCVSIAALASLFAAPALAQTAGDWKGPYAGLQLGYQTGSADHSFDNGAPSDDSEPDGFIVGGHGGYAWRHRNFVFGVEGDIEAGEVEGDYVNLTGATSVGEVETNWQASLRGRFGWAHGANLFYGTVGVAWADQDFSGGPAPAPACCGYSDTVSGWTAGLGYERMATGHLSYRAEYRHSEFDDASGAMPPTFPGVIMEVEQSTDALRFAASYHF
jgi:outer membrane immunogenic protein